MFRQHDEEKQFKVNFEDLRAGLEVMPVISLFSRRVIGQPPVRAINSDTVLTQTFVKTYLQNTF